MRAGHDKTQYGTICDAAHLQTYSRVFFCLICAMIQPESRYGTDGNVFYDFGPIFRQENPFSFYRQSVSIDKADKQASEECVIPTRVHADYHNNYFVICDGCNVVCTENKSHEQIVHLRYIYLFIFLSGLGANFITIGFEVSHSPRVDKRTTQDKIMSQVRS